MAKETKEQFLSEFRNRFGRLHRLGKSLSLFEVGDGAARIYIRYSKVHSKRKTFFGLRKEDLLQLEGHKSFICFLWNNQQEPLFIPYSDYEDIFREISPASDGQYKAHVYLQEEGDEFFIARVGRFNAESYFGWNYITSQMETATFADIPELSHSQVQTLIGSIGLSKGFDIWIPRNDRGKLDWSLTQRFDIAAELPYQFDSIENILSEVDILWIERGAGKLRRLFEVEHSTPIYSGLLRFNDVHLTETNLQASYSIVSNDERRSRFVSQLRRPTFRASGLDTYCSFMNYHNVYAWHKRISELK